MNKYVYGLGSLAVALIAGAMPVVASAREGEVKVEVTAVTAEPVANTTVAPASVTSDDRSREDEEEGRDDDRALTSEEMDEKRAEIQAKFEEKRGEAEAKILEKRLEMWDKIEKHFELTPGTTTRAVSLEDLRKLREERRAELEDEEASTTPELKDVLKNANEVRLAVHTLLESEDLTGGIGPKISEIAKHMNDSVGTTTNAEAQIQSRGLLRKLFLGGDKTAADIILKTVETNKENIAKLSELLADPEVSVAVATDLKAQIEVLEKAQDRLTDLADKETKRFSLLGWLFNR